jgi:hypothetical protein
VDESVSERHACRRVPSAPPTSRKAYILNEM